jgi:hypothetical protein
MQNIKNSSLQCQIMINWHDSSLMIVKSADPTTLEGASLKKMFHEIESLIVHGYTLKSITECNGEIFVFLLNESEIKRQQK